MAGADSVPGFLRDPFARSVAEAFCTVGARVWNRGYVASNDGNFSYRLDADRVLATPTMMSKGFLRPEDMVLVDLSGRQLDGHRRTTSEVRIHLNIYRQRPDVYCVVHAHPPHATAFALTREGLPRCVMAEAEVNLGLVPIAPYETTGTWDFAHSIDPWVRNHDVFLVANHGAVVLGVDPFDAYYRLETLDQYARTLLLARQLGALRELDTHAMEELLDLKTKLRLADPRRYAGAPLCGHDVPPSPAITNDGTLRFIPRRDPITDEPKAGLPQLHPSVLEMQKLERRDLADETREIMRRMKDEG